MPLVTVILNSYNQERFLAQAIDSVLAQTFSDFELIVLDNGSTDGSAALVRSYDDPRIVPLLRTDNQAISKRFNEALACARGELVSFLYSDDMYLPNKLERQVQLFASLSDAVGVVYCPGNGLNELTGARWTHPTVMVSGSVLRELFERHHEGTINMISPMTRRRCFEGEPFHEDLFAEGEAYFYRLAMKHEFHHDPEPLVVMRDHGGNAGKALRKNHEMTMTCLDRLASRPDFPAALVTPMRRFQAMLDRDQGWSMVRLEGDMAWARRCLVAAVRGDVRRIADPKIIFGALMSYAPKGVRAGLNRAGSLVRRNPGNTRIVEGYR